MSNIVQSPPNFLQGFNGQPINYLTEEQVNRLTKAFQDYYDDKSISYKKRRWRGRRWLVYLVLRFTGARIGEVLKIKYDDIDFRKAGIKLITLKRHNPKNKNHYRFVPVPPNVISEIATYIAQYPEEKDSLFQMNHSGFFKIFKNMCKDVGISDKLAHPHILRHTRAIEMLRAGVPVTIVQDLLGHSALTTTAVYLKVSGQEAEMILREKGLI